MKNRILFPRQPHIDLERPPLTDPNLVVTVDCDDKRGHPGIIYIQWITPGCMYYIETWGITKPRRYSFNLGLFPYN